MQAPACRHCLWASEWAGPTVLSAAATPIGECDKEQFGCCIYFLPRNWRAPRQTPLQLTTLSSLSQGKSAQSAAMDSPIVAQLFRQLFRHRPQGCQGRLNPICNGFNTVPRLRSYATRASIDRGMKTNESRWQQRTHLLPEDRTEEHIS